MRDSPCTPRLRSVSSYGNIRAVTSARSLNKSLQNLSLTEECEIRETGPLGGWLLGAVCPFSAVSACPARLATVGQRPQWPVRPVQACRRVLSSPGPCQWPDVSLGSEGLAPEELSGG